MSGLSKAQLTVLQAIYVYQARNNGVSPSYQDLINLTGHKSKSGIHAIAQRLCDKGFIYFEPGMARSFHITEYGEAFLNKWRAE